MLIKEVLSLLQFQPVVFFKKDLYNAPNNRNCVSFWMIAMCQRINQCANFDVSSSTGNGSGQNANAHHL